MNDSEGCHAENHDSMNRLVEHHGWAGERVVRYDRNVEHTWEWITDAKGVSYATSFDALHRKVFQHYPADLTRADPGEHFWYDAVGNLRLYKNPADQYKHLDYADSYDSRNRPRHAGWNLSETDKTVDRAVGPEIRTEYDDASRLTSVTTNGGETTVAFGYDDANRKIWEDQTLSGYPTWHVQTDRDADGNRSDLVAPYFFVYYRYTERNQLSHILDGNGNPFYDFAYDASGNLTQRQALWWPGNVSGYQYDALNRVTMGEHGTNGWNFARSWYQYDRVGREVTTWREEDNGMGGSRGESYTYSNDNQLTSVRYNADQVWTGNPVNWERSVDYSYTPDRLNRQSVSDNGTVTGYTMPNGMNQYTSVGTQSVGYDLNFNLTTYDGKMFSYDAQNRLVNGSMQATYDGLGRCVRRTTSSGTRLYTYDDWNPIVEWDGAGNFAGWNMYGARADEILMRWDVSRGPQVYKQDQHGNVVAFLDGWGNIVERYSYDAFGKVKVTGFWDNNDRGNSWYGNRFMFQGREYISDLGIYDYRHRMYHPGLGRFLQVDPTGFAAGDLNLFRYCGDDPIDGSDPTGLQENKPGSTIEERMRLFYGSESGDSLSELDHRDTARVTLELIPAGDRHISLAEVKTKDGRRALGLTEEDFRVRDPEKEQDGSWKVIGVYTLNVKYADGAGTKAGPKSLNHAYKEEWRHAEPFDRWYARALNTVKEMNKAFHFTSPWRARDALDAQLRPGFERAHDASLSIHHDGSQHNSPYPYEE